MSVTRCEKKPEDARAVAKNRKRSDNPLHTIKAVNVLLDQTQEVTNLLADSLRWGLPMTIVAIGMLSLALVGLLFAAMYRMVQEGTLYRELSRKCIQSPNMCIDLLPSAKFSISETISPTTQTSSICDILVEAVVYSVIVGSLSTLCAVAKDAWKVHLALRKWIAEMKGTAQFLSLPRFLFEKLKSDSLLTITIGTSAVFAFAFILCPPEAISLVIPLWHRLSIVATSSSLFANAWVLSRRCALTVQISSSEIIEDEIWYCIHVSCGKDSWQVKRRHTDFWDLFMDLCRYQRQVGCGQVPWLGTRTVRDNLCRSLDGNHFAMMLITTAWKIRRYSGRKLRWRAQLSLQETDIRRHKLECWLCDVVSHPELGAPYKVPSLKAFLRNEARDNVTACMIVWPSVSDLEYEDDEWVVLREAFFTSEDK